MNPKLKILVGMSGSGKSTYAKNFIRNNNNWVKLSRDDYRCSLFGYDKSDIHLYYNGSIYQKEFLITKMLHDQALYLLKAGVSVIIDNTHLKLSDIERTIDSFRKIADIKIVTFHESLDNLIKRDKERAEQNNKPVGELVLKKQNDQYNTLKTNDKFLNLLHTYGGLFKEDEEMKAKKHCKDCPKKDVVTDEGDLVRKEVSEEVAFEGYMVRNINSENFFYAGFHLHPKDMISQHISDVGALSWQECHRKGDRVAKVKVNYVEEYQLEELCKTFG